MTTNLAVIGGGAKAAALAAKAHVLRKTGVADVSIAIFESQELGAHWNGRHGYTDGEQRLCTLAERDVGFPYASMYGLEVDQALHAQFSWASYLLTGAHRYCNWIDGGRRPPQHKEFADYLSWIIKRCEVPVIHGSVSGLRSAHKTKWNILFGSGKGRMHPASDVLYDGVVVSGPGPARRTRTMGASPKLFDGASFWSKLKSVALLLKGLRQDDQIVVIGSGGTAAAVLAWLVRNGHKDRSIVMVADQGALFTRGDSVFENRLFRDDEAWETLSRKHQKQFFDRLNRGVVWGTVMDEVSNASRLVFVNGRATTVNAKVPDSIRVSVRQGNSTRIELRPELVIDASGFEPWWFLELLRDIPRSDRRSDGFRNELQSAMGAGLDFRGSRWSLPRLHAPMLSSAIGPGFGSLMSLGGMSDRILRCYL